MKFKLTTLLALFVAPMALATDVIISPNMGMPVPIVGQAPGPDWANDINASLSIIDSHDHTPGYGVQVPPAGLNINSDLTFRSNNATNLRSTRYTAQSAPISAGSDLGAVYVSGVDLYYNDENGNHIRITQGGSVTGSAGTITGLPSGTASASFAASTFTFQSATNTPAIMAVGPLKIGTNTASPHTVTLAPPNGLGANYNLTLPSAAPGSTSVLLVDTSGNMSTQAITGSGNIVASTSPTISSASISGGTITSAAISGGSLAGTISGSPTLSGSPTIATLTLSSTGGNVPHGCGISTATNGVLGAILTVTCSASKIALGGGCACGSNSGTVVDTHPSASDTWVCQCTTNQSVGTQQVWATCCTL